MSPGTGAEVSVASASALAAAVANPAIASVVLTSDVTLSGSELTVSGAGRALSIRGACFPSSPLASALNPPAPPGACVLSGAGRSRLLSARHGASVALSNLALADGTATHGGCVLALNGSRVSADQCVFSNCSSLGDGGGVLALARSAAAFSRCAFRACTAAGGAGGGAAAVYDSALSAVDSNFTACRAQHGGGGAAVLRSSFVLSRCSFRAVYAVWAGAGAAAVNSSSVSAANCSFVDSTTVSGGALAALVESSADLLDSTVADCTAFSAGGGLYASFRSALRVRGSALTNCMQRYGDSAAPVDEMHGGGFAVEARRSWLVCLCHISSHHAAFASPPQVIIMGAKRQPCKPLTESTTLLLASAGIVEAQYVGHAPVWVLH